MHQSEYSADDNAIIGFDVMCSSQNERLSNRLKTQFIISFTKQHKSLNLLFCQAHLSSFPSFKEQENRNMQESSPEKNTCTPNKKYKIQNRFYFKRFYFEQKIYNTHRDLAISMKKEKKNK